MRKEILLLAGIWIRWEDSKKGYTWQSTLVTEVCRVSPGSLCSSAGSWVWCAVVKGESIYRLCWLRGGSGNRAWKQDVKESTLKPGQEYAGRDGFNAWFCEDIPSYPSQFSQDLYGKREQCERAAPDGPDWWWKVCSPFFPASDHCSPPSLLPEGFSLASQKSF